MSATCNHPLDRLVDIMTHLRGPDGCPWDREQTHRSLARYAIEEAYEVGAAVTVGDDAQLCDELGDLLLQVVFHAQIAAETDRFGIDDVITAICDKLVRRHPHIFGDATAEDADAVVRNWDAIKAAERGGEPVPESALAKVKSYLPALAHAHALQSAAAKVGFDWDDANGPLDKVAEEAREISEAAPRDHDAAASEWGDLLFALVNLGRHLGFDSETELRGASTRFERRFRYMEEQAPGRLADLSVSDQDALWDKAKDAGL